MKVLLIGSGGREHAIALKLKQSPLLDTLYIAPGNPGTAKIGTNIQINVTDHEQLVQFAKDNQIDLTFVGPEQPLVQGIVNKFNEEGLSIVGPTRQASLLEGSKAWSKELMLKHKIPTATYKTFDELENSIDYIKKNKSYPIVIKADGLAAGKGVVIAMQESEAIQAIMDCFINRKFGDAGSSVVIESYLEGQEASAFAITDGETVLNIGMAQDHKQVFEDDKGPNTGGMGAYSPVPMITDDLTQKINEQVFTPLVKAFKSLGITYKGVIFAGLMINNDEVNVIEFNIRFGDPETQVIIPRLENDLLALLVACENGTLHEHSISFLPQSSACVVLTAGGYPGSYVNGKLISGIDMANQRDNVHVVHAGTTIVEGQVRTYGGRVLGVVGTGNSLRTALSTAYDAVHDIHFEGVHFRRDIGRKGLPTSAY